MFEFNLICPKLENLGYVQASANIKEKHDRSTPSNHHWKILKCRMIIFSTSSVLACPDKSNEKLIHIVFNQHGSDYDTIMSLFSKFSLQQVGGIKKVTHEMYLTCFGYTVTARLAPTWNLLGYNYFINNRDFLTTSGPQNGIQFFFNTNGESINMKIKPVKIHLIKSNETLLPEEYVRVLPSLNKAVVKERFKSLPTGGDFKSYKDLRRHWKNILALASAFVETLLNKMPYNVTKSSSNHTDTVNVLFDENEDSLKTQAVSLCTPSQSQRVHK